MKSSTIGVLEQKSWVLEKLRNSKMKKITLQSLMPSKIEAFKTWNLNKQKSSDVKVLKIWSFQNLICSKWKSLECSKSEVFKTWSQHKLKSLKFGVFENWSLHMLKPLNRRVMSLKIEIFFKPVLSMIKKIELFIIYIESLKC